MRYLPAILFLVGCQAGGQWSPYAEIQTRDEEFTTHNVYDGETYMVGVRYVPPTRLDAGQLVRLESALRPMVGGQPIVIDHKDAQDNDLTTTLVDKGLSVETWTGVAGLFAIALILWIIRRKRKAK